MMDQNFSSQQLIKLCKQREWEEYSLSKEDLLSELDDNFKKIIDRTFNFDIYRVGDYFKARSLAQKLILRKLNDNLKRLYKDEQSNRRIIIKQVKALLEENAPMWVLKTDIEKFYESIDRTRLIAKLKNDAMLSYHSITILEKLFDHPDLAGESGLPRGLSISSTLSEMYMRKFDRWVQRIPNVYYYARFVDDIIIFCNNKKNTEEIKNSIDKNLEDGLKKKESKTAIYDGNNIKESHPLEYLGYKFTKSSKNLTVSIARKKVKKIKTRIALALADFFKTGDFGLFEKRIKFLTGNYSIKKSSEGEDLKAGIFYNYCNLTHHHDLHELNTFFRKMLSCKSRDNFGLKLDVFLSNSQKDRLKKYSFVHGHRQKIYHPFTMDQMNDIKRCW